MKGVVHAPLAVHNEVCGLHSQDNFDNSWWEGNADDVRKGDTGANDGVIDSFACEHAGRPWGSSDGAFEQPGRLQHANQGGMGLSAAQCLPQVTSIDMKRSSDTGELPLGECFDRRDVSASHSLTGDVQSAKGQSGGFWGKMYDLHTCAGSAVSQDGLQGLQDRRSLQRRKRRMSLGALAEIPLESFVEQ
jgi:hypothetical protein